MARNSFGGRSAGKQQRMVGLAVLFGGLLVAVILAFALTGGGEEAARSAPGGAAATPPPPATTVEEKPPVEAEPVSRPNGEKSNEATTPPEGATNEPGIYDPLETGAKPGDLSETQKRRINMAATNFVLAAYGYTGDKEKEYTTPLNRTIFPYQFYESPGAAYVNDYRRRIKDGGVKSSAVAERFELKESSLEEAKGVVHFVVEDDLGKRRMTQELTLYPHRAIWRVSAAGEIETQE